MTSSACPEHVAIIMDGNGRWAEEQGLPRLEGHRRGVQTVRQVVEESIRVGIRHLTLFAFSTENWQRSDMEVRGLMELFREFLESQIGDLLNNGVRLLAVGDTGRLPLHVRTLLKHSVDKTAKNDKLNLILAISYGGREEIIAATRKIAQEVSDKKIRPEDISHQLFERSLWTAGIPDPDLLIRTSGEVRISNFLLWQLAYSEIVIAPEYWPEFDGEVFTRCLKEYQSRERRFGLTAAQLPANGNGKAHSVKAISPQSLGEPRG